MPIAHGNVQMWGITGVQKEALLAAKTSLVTVEEIVEDLEPMPGPGDHPGLGDHLRRAVAPNGAHPSYAHGYYDRDNDFYVRGTRSAGTATPSPSG